MRLTIAFYVDSVPFTRAVLSGEASLGGSESACLGLARALKGLGHDVHIIATQLDEECEGPDVAGVAWHHADSLQSLNQFIEWDVFCVLRMYPVFSGPPIRARLRLLWNQDLLTAPKPLMGSMWAVDQMVYVSEYQRRQYEDRLPELKGVPTFVTKNGYDPTLVPTGVTKDPHRIIHISRPERGLRPLLTMWPAIRKAHPAATLQICRYNSMYDAQGWGKICAEFDEAVAEVNQAVGGITYLGELGKPALYRAIAEAAVMWYPGIHDFAETSCIAAIESQANGTPFVGSLKGALPETVRGGTLIAGNADTPEYQQASISTVLGVLDGCARQSFQYRAFQKAGRDHVRGYTYDALAAEWQAWLIDSFRARYQANRLGILRQMLHDDDHVAAKEVARDVLTAGDSVSASEFDEARDAAAFCDHVIAGKDQTADQYAAFALDTRAEVDAELKNRGRMMQCVPLFEGCTHVLDVACGNGAMAILLAKTYPTIRVTGIDYSEGNIAAARAAADEFGFADRLTFIHAPFWDFEQQIPEQSKADARPLCLGANGERVTFDGAFVGEFLEHVGDCAGLVDAVEQQLAPAARVVYTCPHGPFNSDLLARGTPIHRGHVHQFCHDDIDHVFGLKRDLQITPLPIGVTRRGADVGHWMITYRTAELGDVKRPARPRDLAHRAVTCRPLQRLSVGLIVGPSEPDLRRCLESVWGQADEIVIGDCGMDASERAVAQEFGARIIDVGPVANHPQGFAGARNAVLKASIGEWFLWIDADERLLGGIGIRKYLGSGPYNGFALHQNHLLIDGQNHYDTPIRLFRTKPTIQFYGCVHEQPQMGDANGDIVPALEIADVSIAHTGYLVESVRRDKMMRRNLPLLKLDQKVYPERRLGRLLWLRDFVNLSDYEKEQHGGQLTPKCRDLLRKTIALFEMEFASPSDKYHALARPWYENALKQLGIGYEIELALGGRRGGLKNTHAKPRRIWVRQHADIEAIVQHELADIKAQMHPEPLKTDPFVDEPVEHAAAV